jgi:predicted molibdopterin-dependent oxidoreductase YjgC
MDNKMTFTIDGKEAEARPGTTILQIAREMDMIYQPCATMKHCSPTARAGSVLLKYNGETGPASSRPAIIRLTAA